MAIPAAGSASGWGCGVFDSGLGIGRLGSVLGCRGVRCAGRSRRLQPVRRAGVAQSEGGASGPGEARLLATGALLQQVAQASGLVALLVIVTVLARRLSLAELGAYGLVASLAGYLLVLRNSVASSAVRAMAAALDPEERARVFSAAAALYAVVGLLTGLLIALRRAHDRRNDPRGRAGATTRAPAASGSGCSRRRGSPPPCGSTRCAPSAASCAAPLRRSPA